jgi:hypothetical protein
MDALLLAVLLVLFLLILYKPACEFFNNVGEGFNGSKVQPADMVSFRSDDPIKAKYSMQNRDGWGLNRAEKYYENLVYYNQGLSAFDPAGGSMFDDPAGAPPLPGMSEVERLGIEVLHDQIAAGQEPSEMKFAAPLMVDSAEDMM